MVRYERSSKAFRILLARSIDGSAVWRIMALLLLTAVFGMNIYRATTQSITTDEAFTYERFVSKPFAGLLEPFDANNHVLNSLLARLSITMFGLSEWSLRLPSVMGGAIYLLAAYRLCFLLFGDTIWGFLATALLTTDPFLLDHLSAARGYGLALGLLFFAAYAMIRIASGIQHPQYAAGVCLGLAIAANLTSLFPAAAFIIALIAMSAAQGRLKMTSFWRELFLPAALISLIFLVLPLSSAQRNNFYFGAARLADCVHFLAYLSFLYGPIRLSWLSGLHHGLVLLSKCAGPFALALLFASVWFASRGLWTLHRDRSCGRSSSELNACFFSLSFAVTAGLITAGHIFADIPYPLMRTGLYLIPLTLMTSSCILYRYRNLKPIRYSAGFFAALCLAAFLLQVNSSYYAEWRFDAGTKNIVKFIRSRNTTQKHLVIHASWPLEPSLNFYRVLYGMNWDRIDRSGPEKSGDFVVLIQDDQNVISRSHLQVVYRDGVSGTVVAVPKVTNGRPNT